jgi:hypothetical protein
MSVEPIDESDYTVTLGDSDQPIGQIKFPEGTPVSLVLSDGRTFRGRIAADGQFVLTFAADR